MISNYFNKRTKRFQQLTLLIVVVIVGSIGTYLLTNSHAANPYVSTTAASGSVTGNATEQSCSGASSGSCVVFSNANTGSNKGVPFIGLNDFTGWGPNYTNVYYADGFRWAREGELGSGYQTGSVVDADLSQGINVLIIVPDNETEAMSWINHYGNNPHVIYEFGNEAYLSNSGDALSAQAYAQAYEATYKAKHAAGITQPLLFMTTGDPCWSIAVDSCTNGAELYLEKAMDATKGGVSNLQVDAFSTHTYGGVNGDTSNHTNGVDALLAQHQDAVNHGFTNTPWYVTEWGVTLNPAQASNGPSATDCYYAKSYADQASCIDSAYTKMIAYGDGTSGTWLQGIMYYQTHDDSTGDWGLFTNPGATAKDYAGELIGNGSGNTPVSPRPSYSALKAFLTNH